MSNQFFAERSISHSKIALHLLTKSAEGTGSAGSLAATERHLSDMQRIAFTLLEPMPCETKRA